MKKLFSGLLILIPFLTAQIPAADKGRARIAILNFYDRTGSKNYAWVGTTLADNIERSMNARFEYDRTDALKTQAAADKLLQGEVKTDKVILAGLQKDTGAAFVIFGDYSLDAKQKNLVIKSLVYDLAKGEKISESSKTSPTDSRLFTAVDDVVKNIVADIYKFAESKAGKESNIKVKEFNVEEVKLTSVKLMKLKKNERLDFKENKIGLKAGKFRVISELRMAKGSAVVVDGKTYGPYDYKNPVETNGDLSAWGFIGFRGGKFYLVMNGKTSGPFERVAGFEITPEGKMVTMTVDKGKATYAENGKNLQTVSEFIDGGIAGKGSLVYFIHGPLKKVNLTLNGKKYGPYDIVGNGFLATQDGKFWKTEFTRDGKKYLLVNGKEFGPWPDIYTYQFAYDSDSGNWAAVVRDEKGQNSVITASKSYGPYQRIDRLEVTGTQFGYIAVLPGNEFLLETNHEKVAVGKNRPGLYKSGNDLFAKYVKAGVPMIRANGKEFSGYNEMDYPGDYAKNWYISVRKNNQSWLLSEKGEIAGPYNRIWSISAEEKTGKVSFVAIRPDQKNIFYSDGKENVMDGRIDEVRTGGKFSILLVAGADEKITVHVNDQKYGPFISAQSPVISTDGKIWAVPVETEKGWQALVMGKLFGADCFQLAYLEEDKQRGFFWVAADSDGTVKLEKLLLP